MSGVLWVISSICALIVIAGLIGLRIRQRRLAAEEQERTRREQRRAMEAQRRETRAREQREQRSREEIREDMAPRATLPLPGDLSRSWPEKSSRRTVSGRSYVENDSTEETTIVTTGLPYPVQDLDFDGIPDYAESGSSFASSNEIGPAHTRPEDVVDPSTWAQGGCQPGEPSTGVTADCAPVSTPDSSPAADPGGWSGSGSASSSDSGGFTSYDSGSQGSSYDSGSSSSSSYDSGSSSYDSGSSSSSYDSGSSSSSYDSGSSGSW